MNVKITILKDFVATVEGELNPITLPAGTILVATKLMNNGSPFMAYKTEYQGKTTYVKPTCGYVQTEE